tara:strand:- start:467 stop:622 length:156 start_codon:yes stop_codon:yes gene_type:complete
MEGLKDQFKATQKKNKKDKKDIESQKVIKKPAPPPSPAPEPEPEPEPEIEP